MPVPYLSSFYRRCCSFRSIAGTATRRTVRLLSAPDVRADLILSPVSLRGRWHFWTPESLPPPDFQPLSHRNRVPAGRLGIVRSPGYTLAP